MPSATKAEKPLIDDRPVTDCVECELGDRQAGTVVGRCSATLHQPLSCGKPDCQSSESLCSYVAAIGRIASPPVTQWHNCPVTQTVGKYNLT